MNKISIYLTIWFRNLISSINVAIYPFTRLTKSCVYFCVFKICINYLLDNSWQVVCEATSCSMRCEWLSTFCLRSNMALAPSVGGCEADSGSCGKAEEANGGDLTKSSKVSLGQMLLDIKTVTVTDNNGVWHWADNSKMASLHIQLFNSGEELFLNKL